MAVPVMAADDDMDFDFETEGQVRTRADYWDNSVDAVRVVLETPRP